MTKTKTDNDNQILPETRWVAVSVIPFFAGCLCYFIHFSSGNRKIICLENSAIDVSDDARRGLCRRNSTSLQGVLRSKQWHKIKVGFLPVIAFASLLGIATILHWDRFNHGHISFIAWAGLYFTAPFIVLAVWVRNRNQEFRADRYSRCRHPVPGSRLFTRRNWRLFTLGISLFLFLQPVIMIGLWPWTLTPLTARVMGAMFALPGVVRAGNSL